MNTKNEKSHIVERPPVVVVMGHVDHGKSTLLDYIRKSNIVGGEAGGITQHISTYEVTHKDENGVNKNITFLDTPGHEAFSKMRTRGAEAADIAILVVSAEDSVKNQTLEAYETIKENNIPFIVAINKIDKSNSNIEKTKNDLVEKGIYLEGMGGDIPFVPISSKTGLGVSELLDMILLVSMMHSLTGDIEAHASGVVIESNREPKCGISATLIIKNGTLKSGVFVVAGESMVKARILENFLGKPIKEATFSSPVRLFGFDSIPEIGSKFLSFKDKKEAENYINNIKSNKTPDEIQNGAVSLVGKIIPIIIKTDVSGTIEALEKEISKLNSKEISFKIISTGVGAINESDLKMANINNETIIIGFNTKIDNGSRTLNEQLMVNVQFFDIIYKLIDWLTKTIEEKRPRTEQAEVIGTLKVLKTFSATRDRQVIGGRVITGRITEGSNVRIIRRDFEIGRGKIVGLQINKIKIKEILEDTDCGILVESKIDIAPNDLLETFSIVIK